MSKRLFLVWISLSFLSACGFKLRGSFQLPVQLSEMLIKGGERELVEQLTGILTDNGVTVTTADANASTLSLLQTEFVKESVSTDATGIATEFEYTWLVEFSVIDANGEVLLSRSSLSVSNTLEYDPEDELEFEEEEEFLKEEMTRDVSLQIMRELSRL